MNRMRQSDPRYHCATERAEAFARVRVTSFLLRCCACEGEVVFLPAARRRDGICSIEFCSYTQQQVNWLEMCMRVACVLWNVSGEICIAQGWWYIYFVHFLFICAKRKKAEKRFEVARHIFYCGVLRDCSCCCGCGWMNDDIVVIVFTRYVYLIFWVLMFCWQQQQRRRRRRHTLYYYK